MAGHDPDTRQSSPDTWEAPLLITNPTDDRTFRDDALAGIRSGQDPDGLERNLRPQYPSVTVHERLVSDEPLRVWYVYREGRWVGRGSGRSELPQGNGPAAPSVTPRWTIRRRSHAPAKVPTHAARDGQGRPAGHDEGHDPRDHVVPHRRGVARESKHPR
jgi:hypothetical protein